MLDDFLNNTCTISEKQYTMDRGEEVVSETILYENIPCYIYAPRWDLKFTDEALNTVTARFKVMTSDHLNLKANLLIEVNGEKFKILDTPKENCLWVNSDIDSLEFHIW